MTAAQRTPPAPVPPWLVELQREWSAELHTTPISWVLLRDDRAIKFKRPLKTSFLDFSSPAQRRRSCDDEVRLNRRFAPELYLGVQTFGTQQEPAVVMRRFDATATFDARARSGSLNRSDIEDVVDAVVRLHTTSRSVSAGQHWGDPDTIWRWVANTLAELEAADPPPPGVAELRTRLTSEFHRSIEVFRRRHGNGSVHEGHGDLHLANIVRFQGRTTMFDGIEFNAELRWVDIASELAFVYMDLLRYDRPDLAAALVERWWEARADLDGMQVLRFYAASKALVRAMVASHLGRHRDRDDYLTTAQRICAARTPVLRITHGPSGSGKTTVSEALVLNDPAAATVRLRSDVERKRLRGLNTRTRAGDASIDVYSAEATESTYRELARLSRELLRQGWSVVVDATFLDRNHRDLFRALARESGVQFEIISCSAPRAELRRRVAQRRGDASDADLSVLDRQLADYVPLAPDEHGVRCADSVALDNPVALPHVPRGRDDR